MPFILKKYNVTKNKKIQIVLLQDLALTPKFSQRMLSRGRIFNKDMKPYEYSQLVEDDYILIAEFEGHTRGLKPLLTFEEFAIFDKPSNLAIHPNSKKTQYSLLDEIRYHFGKDANQAHRIDAETSGLVIIGKNKDAVNDLATMFENKEYQKSYLVVVEGKVDEEFTINKALKKEGKNIGVRMTTCEDDEGKQSITHIKPIKYDEEKNISLVEAIPITGRQHQIRIHLYSCGHRIVGDPIYGVDDEIVECYLGKSLSEEDRLKATGSYRLWLQANYLEFTFKGIVYKVYSKNRDIYKFFEK